MAAQRTLPAKQITLNMALAVDSISFDAVRVALNLVANMQRLEMTARFFIQRLEQSGISEQRRQPVSGKRMTNRELVDAVVDRIADLEAKQPSPVVPEGLVQAVRFYEQVKRENPPAETGAWKDAVDWVLKEACQVVNTGIKGE